MGTELPGAGTRVEHFQQDGSAAIERRRGPLREPAHRQAMRPQQGDALALGQPPVGVGLRALRRIHPHARTGDPVGIAAHAHVDHAIVQAQDLCRRQRHRLAARWREQRGLEQLPDRAMTGMIELQRGQRAKIVVGEVARVHDLESQRLAQEQVDRGTGQAARLEVAFHRVAQRLRQRRLGQQHERGHAQQAPFEAGFGLEQGTRHAPAGRAEGHDLRRCARARLAAIVLRQRLVQRPSRSQDLCRVVERAGQRQSGSLDAGQQARKVAAHRVDQRGSLLRRQPQGLRRGRLGQFDREQRGAEGGIGAGHAGALMTGARV